MGEKEKKVENGRKLREEKPKKSFRRAVRGEQSISDTGRTTEFKSYVRPRSESVKKKGEERESEALNHSATSLLTFTSQTRSLLQLLIQYLRSTTTGEASLQHCPHPPTKPPPPTTTTTHSRSTCSHLSAPITPRKTN